MSHLPWQRFMFWNGIAAFIWAAAFTGFGYLFGDVIEHLPHNHKTEVVQDSVRQIMLAGLGLFLLIVALRLLIGHLHKRK
jgi:membrane protein DedA with SNARE-associated domain